VFGGLIEAFIAARDLDNFGSALPSMQEDGSGSSHGGNHVNVAVVCSPAAAVSCGSNRAANSKSFSFAD